MSAVIKLGDGKLLRIPGGKSNLVQGNPDYMGVRILQNRTVLVSGKDKGSEITDGVVNSSNSVVIYPDVEMHPRSYQVLVGYNPTLLEYGAVSCPSILSHFDISKLCMRFDAHRKVDLGELEYIFELYLID